MRAARQTGGSLAVLEMEMDERDPTDPRDPRDLSSERAQPCWRAGTVLVVAGGGAASTLLRRYLKLGRAHSPVLGSAKCGLWSS